jgi:hemoglobin/transferrin/lactoferrin receptor protein
LFTVSLSAQRIKVVSENNGKPIESVAIFNKSRASAAITDSLGYSGKLNFLPSDTIVFQHPSYNTVLYPFTEVLSMRTVKLTKKNIFFDEFIISASKSRESKQIVPYTVSVMKEKGLEHDIAQSSADILMSTGNILIQKTQAGGGSPILRGFEANKILLVVDGVRMNNAIYRSGHLQNSITIDNAVLNRTEVIFGPSSLIYGSDALGGVIHYFTKSPQFSENQAKLFSGGAYVQHSTANSGKLGHLNFNVGGKKLASLTAITYKDLGNIQMGTLRNRFYGDWGKTPNYVQQVNNVDSMFVNEDENTQCYTAYQQVDFLQKIKYQQNEFIDWTLNVQYSTSSDIHRLDKLNDYSGDYLKYAEYYYGPQNRFMASIKNENRNNDKLFTNVTSIFAYQRIDEDRITRKFQSVERLYQLETVNVLSLNIDFLKVWDANTKLN